MYKINHIVVHHQQTKYVIFKEDTSMSINIIAILRSI
jgi:hypothetical protein